MIYYIYSFEVFILFLLSYYSVLIKNKYLTYIVIFVLLILTSSFYGFRDIIIYNQDGFTTDTYRYALIWFKEITTIQDIFYGTSSWKADYLFFTIPYIVNFISSNPNIYLFTNAFISFGLLFYAYYKIINGKKYYYLFPFVVFLILACSTTVANYANLLRQGLAISLVLMSIAFMLENKIKYGYLFFILALFSHKSVIVFFIIYFFVFHTKIKLKYYFYILFFSLPFTFFNILGLIGSNFLLLSEKINSYQGSNSRMLIFKAMILFVIAIFLYNFFKNRKYSYIFEQIFKIYISVLIIAFISFKIEIISGRLLYYPSILLPYFIFNFIFYIKQKNLYFYVVTILTIAYGLFILLTSSTYKTIHFTNTLL